MFEAVLKNKIPDFKKLFTFGFKQADGKYTYSVNIVGGQFCFVIEITSTGNVKTKVIDQETHEDYILHLTTDAVGAFVGSVRTECQNILQNISDNCFETNIFQSNYACQIIQYLQEKYHDELEFLWEKFPDNAIVRRKDNKKWYAALLVISKQKLGLESAEPVEIIDLRETPVQIATMIDSKKYFPGYHMNKKHWLTICLDGSVPLEEIYKRIDTSYLLAKK